MDYRNADKSSAKRIEYLSDRCSLSQENGRKIQNQRNGEGCCPGRQQDNLSGLLSKTNFPVAEIMFSDEGNARAEIAVYKIFEGALTGSLPR